MRAILFGMLSIILVAYSCSKKTISRKEYKSQYMSNIAEIYRDKDTKNAYLRVKTSGKWTLFSGPTVASINLSQPLLEGKGGGTFPLELSNMEKSYFQLITDDEKNLLTEKHLPMAGGYNFRDLGGIKTRDGRMVQWGKIFRSDDLHQLIEADLKYLSSIPIRSIVDFRSEEEIKEAPDKIPSSAIKDYAYSITPGNLSNINAISEFSTFETDSLMREMNILLVTSPEAIDQYRNLFKLLQEERNSPLLFHCSAGKDRTGMAAALILFALGVDEETIFDDYLASNIYLSGKYDQYLKKYPHLKPLFEVRREYLQAGLRQIKKDHGSVENYLTNTLNVNIPKFRKMYLYD